MKITSRSIGMLAAAAFIGMTMDGMAWGQRGGRGGGGRVGGGGGRVGGGGISRPSGGGISRPSGGGFTPGGGGISRPSGGGINRSPSFSAPKISQPSISRPTTQPGLKPGGPSIGTRDQPGIINGPRPSTPGLRPGGPDITTRPIQPKTGGPATGIDIGKGAIGKPGLDRPGLDGGRLPGVDPKSGFGKVDPKYGVRPGARPGVLPGLGLGAGVGGALANRDGPGRRQDRVQDRKANLGDRTQNMQDRLESRHDFWNQAQDKRQDFLNNRREDWQNWHNDYYHHHDYWHHGYWGCNGWWQHMWSDHTAAMIFGTTLWGWNRMNYWFGLGSYYNPYYVAPIPVGDTYIDNSVSLAVPPTQAVVAQPAAPDQPAPPPGVTDPGMKAFADAQAAFHEGDYATALKQVNQALVAMPKDAIVHEFRALVLFALGNYNDAAATLHPVLAVTPGWNWTTMSSLYPDVETYTGQLRKLEDYVDQNPKSAQGHFVLAYHYLTCGHEERAQEELKEVVKLAPKDTVAAQLRQLLASKDQSIDEAKDPPAKTKIDEAALIGAWTAQRGAATFELVLDKDHGFTWTYREGKTTQSVKGAYAIDGANLSLEPDAGGVMLADITAPMDGAFTFRAVGAAKDDPGLRFTKK